MTADRREPQVVVLGGGSWGTTVASICARRGPTLQWVRSAETVDDINKNHRNSRYLGEDVDGAQRTRRAEIRRIVSPEEIRGAPGEPAAAEFVVLEAVQIGV